jgi:hypothetical protein
MLLPALPRPWLTNRRELAARWLITCVWPEGWPDFPGGYRPREITLSLGAVLPNLPVHLIQAMPMLVLGLVALAWIALRRAEFFLIRKPGAEATAMSLTPRTARHRFPWYGS